MSRADGVGERLTPHAVTYRLDYGDGSGPKLLVELKDGDVWIRQHGDSLIVPVADVPWLISALSSALANSPSLPPPPERADG